MLQNEFLQDGQFTVERIEDAKVLSADEFLGGADFSSPVEKKVSFLEKVGNFVRENSGLATLSQAGAVRRRERLEALPEEKRQEFIERQKGPIAEPGVEMPSTLQQIGAGIKLGSLFVPGATTAKLALGGAGFSVGQQLEEGSGINAKRTILETGTSVILPKLLAQGAKTVLAPALERFSKLSDESLQRIFNASKEGDDELVSEILKDNKIIDAIEAKKMVANVVENIDPNMQDELIPHLEKWSRTDTVEGIIKSVAREAFDMSDWRFIARALASGGVFLVSGPIGAVAATLAGTKVVNAKATAYLGRLWPYIERLEPQAQKLIISAMSQIQ